MEESAAPVAGAGRGRSTGGARRAAAVALVVTVLLGMAKVATWAATGSLAILSQALDSVVDVVGLTLVFVAVRVADKPADESHHYGHGKAENLAAFTQTLLLIAVVGGVVLEAARRVAGEAPDVGAPAGAIALMAASAVVDVLRVRYLTGAARAHGSDALRAGALNLAADVGTALVALASLVAVRAGFEGADAIGALVVAAAVTVAAARLGKRSVDVLMDRAPARAGQIEAATTAAAGVAETRRVRVRGTGSRLFADVTVAAGRTTSLERAHDIAERVEREIDRAVPGTDVVVHVEPVAETSELVERVQAAASRVDDIHEVHNVSVRSIENSEGAHLRITLHAKARPGLSLQEAHRLSDDIESSVRQEVGDDARVDSHIEPLEATAPGRDATAERRDLVDSVTRLAQREPDVLDCHEVVVTSSGGELAVVAHVTGRPDLPLARIHAASTRIEQAIRSSHADVGPVLIHFEPLATG
ncbi:MAG TPA: cation-efflux pump [Actinomycetota bacterium]|nr:cation-efflux pump [Actinomycetota bacterium]